MPRTQQCSSGYSILRQHSENWEHDAPKNIENEYLNKGEEARRGMRRMSSLLVDLSLAYSCFYATEVWISLNYKHIKIECKAILLSYHWFQNPYLEKPKHSINSQSLTFFWIRKEKIIEGRKWIFNPETFFLKSVKTYIKSQVCVTVPNSFSKQVVRTTTCSGQPEIWISPGEE